MTTIIKAYPQAGDRVRGKHIFGNSYVGTITESRPHTMDRDRTVVFIRFDSPTDLGISPSVKTGDVRAGICTEVYPPAFKGDTQWQDGHGSSFEILP